MELMGWAWCDMIAISVYCTNALCSQCLRGKEKECEYETQNMEVMDGGPVGCGHPVHPSGHTGPVARVRDPYHGGQPCHWGHGYHQDKETDYWNADKAVDGIVNRDEANKQNQSRWSTNGARTFDQVAQKDKVLTVDLGSAKSFDQLVLEWERANVTQFKIEAAGDNQEYSTMYEKTDGAEIDSLTTTIDLEEKQTAQYVRLTVSGYTPGDIDWASVSLWELEILETVPAENLALQEGVEATADSVETADFPAAKAIDGNADRDVKPQSRWASAVDENGSNPARWLALKFPAQHTHTVTLVKGTPATCTQDGVKDDYV